MLFLMIFTIKKRTASRSDSARFSPKSPGTVAPEAQLLFSSACFNWYYCKAINDIHLIFSRKMHIFFILFKCLIICSAKVKYFLITTKFQLVSVANFYISVIVLTIK